MRVKSSVSGNMVRRAFLEDGSILESSVGKGAWNRIIRGIECKSKILELEAQVNEYAAKMEIADEQDNLAMWQRYRHYVKGFNKALRIMGYTVDWDAEDNRYTVREMKEV